MFSSKSYFDYEAILEACGRQDENVKTAIEEKDQIEAVFYEQLDILKKLNAERDEQLETLMNVTNDQKTKMLKLDKLKDKISVLNVEQKLIQNEIVALQEEFGERSEEFVQTIVEMDGQLEALYLQFEEETLVDQMEDVDKELEYSRNLEDQLQRKVCELRNSKLNLSQYDRPTTLKTLMAEYSAMDLEEIKRLVAEKQNNIEYLKMDYDANLELLEKYN